VTASVLFLRRCSPAGTTSPAAGSHRPGGSTSPPGAAAINDSWIAATAIAHDVPIVTQDADYDVMPGVQVIKI
jgi:predicted nucleic acid-binding protein